MSVRMQLVPDGDANRRAGSKPIPRLLPPRNVPILLPRSNYSRWLFLTRSFGSGERFYQSSLFFLPDAPDADRSECFVCFEMEFCKMKSTRDFSFFFSFFNKKMRRFLLDEILRIEFRGSLIFQCSIKFVLFLFIQDWNLDDSKSKILENEIKILVKISTVRFR